MIIGDFGTSYCKFLTMDGDKEGYSIVPSRELPNNIQVDVGTGHNGKRFSTKYVNELVALARSGERLITEKSYVLLDCGSRDIKFIKQTNGRIEDMGWNTECGASMGFTVELLEKYYELDYNTIPTPKKTFSVTCGVLGMSHIFDAVIGGMPVSEAVASFVKGIAMNAYRFAGSPEKIFLSGGLCDNRVFVESFPCEIELMGRFALLKGLQKYATEHDE